MRRSFNVQELRLPILSSSIMPIRPILFRRLKLLLALACVLGSTGARAQLHLPQLQLPQLPGRLLPSNNSLLDDSRRLLDRRDVADLRALRLELVTSLIERHRGVLEADPRGEPVVRHEILAWSPTRQALAAARAAGLTVAGDGTGQVVTLRVPDGTDTAAALERLRHLDPDGVYDFNHLYTGSAAQPMAAAERSINLGTNPGANSGANPAASQPQPAKSASFKVGLVDGGIERSHEVFHAATIVPWGCDGTAHSDPHGTAVAALMVGSSARFHGVAPQAALYAADIYCGSATGGSAARIGAALDWLAREQVAVINLSLVGPPNRILERVVRDMVQRGHLLVAAAGNDGPAAPPLYPASYPGVVGVSGVDRQGRPLPEAARGPQVMFAAPGSQMVSAAIGAPPYRVVRGTSFASPIVAAMLAGALEQPSPTAARQALARLAKAATGVPAGTISNETGYGVLGAAYRTDPRSFH
jgi:hypothetical protein